MTWYLDWRFIQFLTKLDVDIYIVLPNIDESI